MCPQFMAMGMTYDQYWNGDNELPKFYRQAHEIQLNEKNALLWMQGVYVYDAIIACAPALNALSKSHKPLEYLEEPLAITPSEQERQEEEKARAKMEAARAGLMAFAERINQKRKE